MSVISTASRRAAVACVLCLTFSVSPGAAQNFRQPPALDPGNVSPADLQRLFDAYALVQAQDALRLDEAQFAKFLPRLRALQEVRRRTATERAGIVQDLRQLLRPRSGVDGRPNADRLGERLKELRDLEARAVDQVRRAVDELDEVLDPEQRARLRIFEEQMDRRKLELLMRARQGARARGRVDRP